MIQEKNSLDKTIFQTPGWLNLYCISAMLSNLPLWAFAFISLSSRIIFYSPSISSNLSREISKSWCPLFFSSTLKYVQAQEYVSAPKIRCSARCLIWGLFFQKKMKAKKKFYLLGNDNIIYALTRKPLLSLWFCM